MKNLLLLFLALILNTSILANLYPIRLQNNNTQKISFENGKIKIIPYGFVFTDLFWDSRQVIGIREDETLFWPRPFCPDVCGRDINARPKFHFLSIRSLIGLKFNGPNISDNVKAGALIETDFFGNSDLNINQLRLRLAYCQLDFERVKSNLIVGQYWHPLFDLDCFPHTVSYSFGEPFDSQARQPQVRYTKNIGSNEISFTALTQRDFRSFGPCGLSTEYIRNAIIPNLNLRFKYYYKDHVFGICADYKRLAPRIVTCNFYKVNEHIDSAIITAYAQLTYENFVFRIKGIYAQNAADQAMMSGYAVRTIDSITDFRTYSNIRVSTIWVDTSYYFEKSHIELGIFLASAKNLGSKDRLFINPNTNKPIIYAIDGDIDYAARISPRFLLKKDPVIFGIELELTRAAFGCPDDFAKIKNTCPVNNFRFLTALYYVF